MRAIQLSFNESGWKMNLFGACGATSGGVDLRPFPEEWEIRDALGEKADNPDVWTSHSVINMIDQIRPGAN